MICKLYSIAAQLKIESDLIFQLYLSQIIGYHFQISPKARVPFLYIFNNFKAILLNSIMLSKREEGGMIPGMAKAPLPLKPPLS